MNPNATNVIQDLPIQVEQNIIITEEILVQPKIVQEAKSKGVIPLICALTLVGNRLGGGIVGLPFAIKTVGFTTAVLFQVMHGSF